MMEYDQRAVSFQDARIVGDVRAVTTARTSASGDQE